MTAILENDQGSMLGENAWEALIGAPGVGVNVCTSDGKTLYCNATDSEMLFGTEGYGLGPYDWADRLPRAWVAERIELVQQALATGLPIRVRSVWRGWQIISSIQPIAGDDRCVIVSNRVCGVLDETDAGEVYTSRFVSLGVMSKLSPREVEVISYIGLGMPTREIAEKLELSPKTVEKHRDAIVRKVGERSRIVLARHAHNAGLLPEDAKRDRV